jgi:hypothetical protein
MNRRQALVALGQLAVAAAAAAPELAGRRILWVDSYHEGNPWNDGIGRGIAAALKDGPLPVVFAGINWDASAYGFPTRTITGMLEVDLVRPLVRTLREYARGDRVAYLSADTQTQAKVVATYNQQFFNGQMQVRLVRTFDEFRRAYLELQTVADMLITGNYTGIAGWNDAAARTFIEDATRIPTGYVDGYMTPLVLVTMGKLPEEQGEYAADTALRILRGAKPGDIPLAENKKAVLGLNLVLADKLGIVFSPVLLKNAGIVYRG